jgi:hypothetical protein
VAVVAGMELHSADADAHVVAWQEALRAEHAAMGIELHDAHVLAWREHLRATAGRPIRAERRRQERHQREASSRFSKLLEALDSLHPEGDPIHIRTPDRPGFGVTAGYFTGDDEGRCALVNAVLPLVGKCDIWVNLNPFDPALIAHAFNTLKQRIKSGTCVADKHVTRFRWILIDCDPRRLAGISSTDGEHQAGLDRARFVYELLIAAGWAPAKRAENSSKIGSELFRAPGPH